MFFICINSMLELVNCQAVTKPKNPTRRTNGQASIMPTKITDQAIMGYALGNLYSGSASVHKIVVAIREMINPMMK